VEEFLVLRGDVFEEGEYAAFGVFVAQRVEYEAFFGYEGVSVAWEPFFCGSRNECTAFMKAN
jgi:hypothetical protein